MISLMITKFDLTHIGSDFQEVKFYLLTNFAEYYNWFCCACMVA